VSASGSTSLTLGWSASAGASGYELQRASGAGSFVTIATPKSASYQDTGLSSGTSYSYQVRATSTAANTLYSAPLTWSTGPAPVTQLQAYGSDTQIIATWAASSQATSYIVLRATDGSSAFARVGSTMNTWFIDNGSAGLQPAPSTGSAYQYQVVPVLMVGSATSDGDAASTAGQSPKPTAMGVTLVGQIKYISDSGAHFDVATPESVVGFETLDGKTHGFSVTTQDGAGVIQGVPQSDYYLTAGTYRYRTADRSVDVGWTQQGRESVELAPTGTVLDVSVSGLDAWQVLTSNAAVGDSLELVNFGAGDGYFGLDGAVNGGLIAGATSAEARFQLDTTTTQYFPDLFDASLGDTTYLTQLAQRSTVNGDAAYPYQQLLKWYSPSSQQTLSGGSVNSLSATMVNAPVSTLKSVQFLRSQFRALSVNPAATFSGEYIDLAAINGYSTDGYYGSGADLAVVEIDSSSNCTTANLPTSCPDNNLGDLAYGNPFPAGWQPFWYVSSTSQISFQLPGTTAPYVYFPASIVQDRLSGLATAKGYSIAPVAQPIAQPQIANGAAAPVSLFADQTGVGLTPTLSWTAPSAAPTDYTIRIFQLSGSSGAPTAGNRIRSFKVPGWMTSFTVPSGVLQTGDWYFVAVWAVIQDGGYNSAPMAPFKNGVHYASSPIVSNKFQP
jgi:hypothetical protein